MEDQPPVETAASELVAIFILSMMVAMIDEDMKRHQATLSSAPVPLCERIRRTWHRATHWVRDPKRRSAPSHAPLA